MSEADDKAAEAPGHIFVSYARADVDRVRPLVEALESLGRRVWWDTHLEGGAGYASEIEKALRSADSGVGGWGRAAATSGWVRDEAGLGAELGRLAPVRLDEMPIPLGFGQYHTIDLV